MVAWRIIRCDVTLRLLFLRCPAAVPPVKSDRREQGAQVQTTVPQISLRDDQQSVIRPKTAFHLNCDPGGSMDWRIIALNFVYATLGVILMYLSYRVIDWLTPDVDFPVELKKGNVAVAIFIAALFLSIAIIVGGALN
jgi:hypothetical protein